MTELVLGSMTERSAATLCAAESKSPTPKSFAEGLRRRYRTLRSRNELPAVGDDHHTSVVALALVRQTSLIRQTIHDAGAELPALEDRARALGYDPSQDLNSLIAQADREASAHDFVTGRNPTEIAERLVASGFRTTDLEEAAREVSRRKSDYGRARDALEVLRAIKERRRIKGLEVELGARNGEGGEKLG